jgi:TRAP-type mannitol/chloroaromatic compound transport system substrate-binding protein
VPFGLTPDEMAAWIRFGGGQTLWGEPGAGFSVKGLLLRSAGTTCRNESAAKRAVHFLSMKEKK